MRKTTWSALALCALAAACDRSAPSEEVHPGQQIYTRYCFSCHAAGVAGAPQVGNPEAWAPRIAKGRDVLIQSTIDGIPPAMPVRGLCSSCSDEEIAAAVDFMIERSTEEAAP